MGDAPLILIVEDDEDMARLNGRLLTRKGYGVALAHSAAQAREAAKRRKPDLFVLDVMLPDGDGVALCRELRADNDAPVLFLTGRREPHDKAAGLGSGGDYYLTKPVDREEFAAVVDALLRRAEQTRARIIEATELTRGPLTLRIPQGKAYVNGKDAELTPKEFAVLHLLMRGEGKEIAGELIYETVWGTTMNHSTGAVRQHISRLKKKLGEGETDSFSILPGYGGGYTFLIN